jgi:hypothetical protein
VQCKSSRTLSAQSIPNNRSPENCSGSIWRVQNAAPEQPGSAENRRSCDFTARAQPSAVDRPQHTGARRQRRGSRPARRSRARAWSWRCCSLDRSNERLGSSANQACTTPQRPRVAPIAATSTSRRRRTARLLRGLAFRLKCKPQLRHALR